MSSLHLQSEYCQHSPSLQLQPTPSLLPSRPLNHCFRPVQSLIPNNTNLSRPSQRSSKVSHSRAVPQNQAGASLAPPTGIFLRDESRSDMQSYTRALALLQLGKLQRLTAVQLIEGIEIRHSGDWISLKFLTVVPFFNVEERYQLGSSVSISRRDLRPGPQTAQASLDADGSLHLKSSWGAPNAGSVDEHLRLLPDDALEYISELKVSKGSEVTKQVYKRVDKWQPKYSWNPIKALQIMSKEGL